MAEVVDVSVPDIGDFKDIDVIEVLVAPGSEVQVEQSLITLESDKATMEIPSPQAGTVKEIKVKVGDKVSKGSPILSLELAEAAGEAAEKPGPAAAKAAPEQVTSPPPASAAPSPAAAPSPEPGEEIYAEVVVLGSGPGGYTAAFRAADLGKRVVLIERYASLGGVCLNVGCIPSKALLHAAKLIDESADAADWGLGFEGLKLDLERLRAWKDGVVGRLTRGIEQLAKQRKVKVVHGNARFTAPNRIQVDSPQGVTAISFSHAIIAAGSQATRIPGFPHDDPRLMDSTGALALADIPKEMLVIGGGIIGLEMATVYHALGSKITVVELHGRPHSRLRPRSRAAARQAHRKAL